MLINLRYDDIKLIGTSIVYAASFTRIPGDYSQCSLSRTNIRNPLLKRVRNVTDWPCIIVSAIINYYDTLMYVNAEKICERVCVVPRLGAIIHVRIPIAGI